MRHLDAGALGSPLSVSPDDATPAWSITRAAFFLPADGRGEDSRSMRHLRTRHLRAEGRASGARELRAGRARERAQAHSMRHLDAGALGGSLSVSSDDATSACSTACVAGKASSAARSSPSFAVVSTSGSATSSASTMSIMDGCSSSELLWTASSQPPMEAPVLAEDSGLRSLADRSCGMHARGVGRVWA